MIPRPPPPPTTAPSAPIIGHEISHTFDSEGAAFDSKGRVRNWWTPEDLAHFNAVTAALAAQYDTYAPFPDLHVNGRQTLGENIADVAGLTTALDAFHASLKGTTAPAFPARQAPATWVQTSSSSSPSPRTGPRSPATPPSASRSSPTPTPPVSTAPTPSATSTTGTRPSPSNPPTNSTWHPKTASASGK